MRETELTSADVIEVARATRKELVGWCEKGLVSPIGGGSGKGDHRLFSVMQAVGLAVAAKLRRSERGCVLPYVGEVVAAFSALTEGDLVDEFEQGRVAFVFVHRGRPLLDGKRYDDQVDVAKTYKEVRERIERLAKRARNRTGRSRGLAGSAAKK